MRSLQVQLTVSCDAKIHAQSNQEGVPPNGASMQTYQTQLRYKAYSQRTVGTEEVSLISKSRHTFVLAGCKMRQFGVGALTELKEWCLLTSKLPISYKACIFIQPLIFWPLNNNNWIKLPTSSHRSSILTVLSNFTSQPLIPKPCLTNKRTPHNIIQGPSNLSYPLVNNRL